MYKASKISSVLSWINIVIGGLLVVGGLFTLAATPNASVLLLSVVLTGSIVLHSYASLQLRKSVVDPDVPLSKQTAMGIRLVGFLALFFAFMNIGNSILIVQNTKEMLAQVPLPPEAENFNVEAILKGVGVFTLLFSVGIIINVILSVRILKWYQIKQMEEE